MHDVTIQRQATAPARGLILFDAGGRVAEADAGALALLQVEDAARLVGLQRDAVLDRLGTPSAREAHRVRPDGTLIEIIATALSGGTEAVLLTTAPAFMPAPERKPAKWPTTERRRAERQLSALNAMLMQQNRRFDATLDNMTHGLVLYDDGMRLQVWNRRYLELYNLPKDRMWVGMTLREVMELSVEIGNYPADRGEAVIRERLQMAEQRCRAVFHQRLVDGTLVRASQEPLADGGTVLTYTDVTDQERREAELRLAKVEAEEANETKSDFLAKMSHELRTPLNAIIGFSEALLIDLWGPLNERQRDYVTDIWSSGAHLLAIINDILDLSKIEAGREEIEHEAVDLAEILGECLRLLTPTIERQRLAVENTIAADLPMVIGDRRRLKQILLNITGNAVKFTGEAGTVAVRACLDTAGWLECTITDTGIGIAPEHQTHVFEPFFQVESPLARNFKGTGLGLALANGLVKLHDGNLAIASREGEGTSVTIRLPPERLAG